MSTINKCLISQDNGQLQIPYEDYKTLMEKVQHGQRMNEVKTSVIANLKIFLGGENPVSAVAESFESAKPAPVASPVETPVAQSQPVQEKVATEFEAVESSNEVRQPVAVVKEPVAEIKTQAPKVRAMDEELNVPPIKNDGTPIS